jgi:xylulokinase
VFVVSDVRGVDPSGLVAGFADAGGRFLPLACTLNCTLAVDRVAAWLGLNRDDVAPSDGVVVLPYFDGERTPNVPNAAAAIFGLRHDTGPRAILMAAYEGAIGGMLDALDLINSCSSGIDGDAPLILVGGGARGSVWRKVARRLSGRPTLIPEVTELVSMGAAVQAASILLSEPATQVASRWRTDRGITLEPVAPDTETMTHLRAIRRLAIEAIQA